MPGSLLVAAVALGVVGGLGWVAGVQIQHLASELPKYQDNILDKVTPLVHLVEGLEKADDLAAPAPKAGEPAATTAPLPVTVVKPSGSAAVAALPAVVLPAAHMLASALLVVVLTVFLLVQRETTVTGCWRSPAGGS